MKLLLNMSVVGSKSTGLGVYASHCAEAVTQAFDTEIVAPATYTGRGKVVHESPGNIILGGGKFASIRRFLWARRFKQPGDRLIYSPTHLGFPHSKHQILTVHDLIALRLPKTNPLQNLYFRHVLPRQLVSARAVFTVSETTRLDIHEQYHLPLDDIHVIPNGVNTNKFYPLPGAKEKFLLMVGASFFHKNVQEVIENANFWKDDYSLVIVSSRGKYREYLDQLIDQSGLNDRVKIIPYAKDDELLKLYQTCAAFLYPSMWEGFGIPPLEALACGARVIVSDIAVLREVLGNSAVYVRLGEPESWRVAFESLISEGSNVSSANLLLPVQKYTWENSAKQLIKALMKVEPALENLQK